MSVNEKFKLETWKSFNILPLCGLLCSAKLLATKNGAVRLQLLNSFIYFKD